MSSEVVFRVVVSKEHGLVKAARYMSRKVGDDVDFCGDIYKVYVKVGPDSDYDAAVTACVSALLSANPKYLVEEGALIPELEQ